MISKIKEKMMDLKYFYHEFVWLELFAVTIGDNKWFNKMYPTLTTEQRWRAFGKELMRHCKWIAEMDQFTPEHEWEELKYEYYEEFREIIIS